MCLKLTDNPKILDMKRVLFLLIAVAMSFSALAQDADSIAFVSTKRAKLRLKNAEGYVLSAYIFDSPQTISVIKFSPSKFSLGVVQPEYVTAASEVGNKNKADFVINACYWAVTTGVPTTFVKSYGKVMSKTHPAALPRVNGLMLMHDNGIEIVRSYDAPYYPGLVEKCDNIIACGPILLDDGEVVDYSYILDSEEYKMVRQHKFFLTRHPRSAIGCNAQGEIFLVVADGRFEGRAEGLSIAELTKVCQWLGMVEAMNLDGGGSSTLWCRQYGVINHPCDNRKFDNEGEREVSSCLVVKKK